MSDEEVTVETTDGQLLTAEYKDGQLQIVEVTPFDKETETALLPLSGDTEPRKYMQVLDTNKGLVHLDLLNLTLVRTPDGEDTYQFVTNTGSDDELQSQVTCVLQSSDNEEHENQESYVMVEDGNNDGLVFLKSTLEDSAETHIETHEDLDKPLTPAEILERAKSLQKYRKALSNTPRIRNRKRKSDLPPHHELLASPNFKLYLYSCKMCSFKCNAIKEMSAHKAAEHAGGSRGSGRNGRSASVTLQCARCPFRGAVHSQLMKHVQEKHLGVHKATTVHLNTEEVEAADVLVCGACGFESSSKDDFRKHIEDEHGAATC